MNFSLWRFTGVLLALGLAIQPTPSVAIGGHTAAHVEPYRPPHVDPPRPPPDRVVQPQEKRLDVDSLVSDAATPGANNESPARQQARLRNWKAITDSLGAETRDPAQAYLAVLVGNNGRALIATNLVRGNSSDRAVHEMTIGDLRDGVKLSAVLDSSLGGAEQSRGVALKFLVGSSVPSDKLRNFVQNDLRSFNLNSARFRFAELIPVGSDRAYSLERIDREAGEPRWLARLNECCVYGGIPPDVEGWSRLANIPFKSRGLQVVSLFADSQTSRELKRSGVALAVEHPEDIGDPAPILRQAFATGDADSPVIVIGHVEQGRFKIETADGGFIGVADVIAMAREAGRPVYLIGCYTADHYKAVPDDAKADYPVTSLSEIHPRELASRLASAIRSSSSLQDFTALISDSNMYVYVPDDFVKNSSNEIHVRADVMSTARGGAKAITALFRAFIPCKLVACQ